jgi:hypothetical protein
MMVIVGDVSRFRHHVAHRTGLERREFFLLERLLDSSYDLSLRTQRRPTTARTITGIRRSALGTSPSLDLDRQRLGVGDLHDVADLQAYQIILVVDH